MVASEHSEFSKLDEVCDLHAAGRENAALAIWQELKPDFRIRVLKFVLFVTGNPQLSADCPSAVFTTKYGQWTLKKERLALLTCAVTALSRFVRGND